MKINSISELQKELCTLKPKQVFEIALKIAKHKKENKELLAYLLFFANNENAYVENLKIEIDTLFSEINRKSAYTTKKGLQKVVRIMNRYINYSDIQQTELELRIYFCKKVNTQRISLDISPIISNLYYREIEKIKAVYSKLHEDLQYDYKNELEKLGVQDLSF
jgi:hypothetical protein